jgi:hypothetical protein
MRASGQAPGADGWLGVLARWAPRSARLQYSDAVRDATMEELWPEVWHDQRITMTPKPGKDVYDLGKRRDPANSPHGWKIVTICLNMEYKRVRRSIMRANLNQYGFDSHSSSIGRRGGCNDAS